MYLNLIPRPGEDGPRIKLTHRNEWRAFFTILEAAAMREYKVDKSGYIKVSFRELHHIFSAGRRGALIEETAQALEALSSKKFNIINPKEKAKGQTVNEEKHIFTFKGNIRIVKEIKIAEIFDHNVNGYFFRLPANFLKTLTEAVQAVEPNGRITNADIILSLYAYQVKHNSRPKVKRPIEVLAKWASMEKLLKERQNQRITETIERSAKVLEHLKVLSGHHVDNENNNITLFFCREAPSVTAKRKFRPSLKAGTI